ncbi:MAG: alpha/beta fold hydrolase [Pseudorhodoplanes sp.]|uniref:alpha/beta fold hydrolase n=1 Tax=Pseudorhodoplanes sp. TaxID=1934341 RepID=UPI003D0BF210
MSILRALILAALLHVAFPVAHAASADLAGLVDIGHGRTMYLTCRGSGAPAVILIGGLRASADDWDETTKPGPAVFGEIAKLTRVCAYDRPGTPVGEKPSRSSPVAQPAMPADAAADLHALLTRAKVAGPVVLVGHSYGGLIARLYAGTWSNEVAGLVLVDALSEGLQDAQTPAQWAVQRKLMMGDMSEALKLYPTVELIDPDKSLAQMRGAPPMRAMPLIVLSADKPWGPQVPGMIAAGILTKDTPPDAGYITDAAQKIAQAKLAALVPGSRHITKTDSGHEIHKEQPQLVIDAIREVVDAVRKGCARVVGC